MELTAKSCIPCRGGVAPLAADAAGALLSETPGWALDETATRIERRLTFKNFAESLKFVDAVSALAEDEGHHPDICFGWGYCTIVLYTHKIKGLHENDFIMAAKINSIA